MTESSYDDILDAITDARQARIKVVELQGVYKRQSTKTESTYLGHITKLKETIDDELLPPLRAIRQLLAQAQYYKGEPTVTGYSLSDTEAVLANVIESLPTVLLSLTKAVSDERPRSTFIQLAADQLEPITAVLTAIPAALQKAACGEPQGDYATQVRSQLGVGPYDPNSDSDEGQLDRDQFLRSVLDIEAQELGGELISSTGKVTH